MSQFSVTDPLTFQPPNQALRQSINHQSQSLPQWTIRSIFQSTSLSVIQSLDQSLSKSRNHYLTVFLSLPHFVIQSPEKVIHSVSHSVNHSVSGLVSHPANSAIIQSVRHLPFLSAIPFDRLPVSQLVIRSVNVAVFVCFIQSTCLSIRHLVFRSFSKYCHSVTLSASISVTKVSYTLTVGHSASTSVSASVIQ